MRIINVIVLITGLFFIVSCVPDDTQKSTMPCTHWKQVCHEKETCGQPLCYRCLRPSQKGFQLYLRNIDRSTCNVRTVEYLRIMGYRCYHSGQSEPCTMPVKKRICEQLCETRADQ